MGGPFIYQEIQLLELHGFEALKTYPRLIFCEPLTLHSLPHEFLVNPCIVNASEVLFTKNEHWTIL